MRKVRVGSPGRSWIVVSDGRRAGSDTDGLSFDFLSMVSSYVLVLASSDSSRVIN